jgi:DNA-binding MarR family transcriptional regulator
MDADEVLELLYRRDVAMLRFRRSLARSLGLADNEVVAVMHLAHGEMRTAALAELLGLSSGGATAFAHRLERMGYTTRRDHPHDRRSSLIGLTPETAATLERAQASLVEGIDEILASVDESARAAAGEFLARVVALTEEITAPQATPDARRPRRPARPVPSLWG